MSIFTIRTIRRKLITYLKEQRPNLTYVRKGGDAINIYTIRTANYSNKICSIYITNSTIRNHYLAIFTSDYIIANKGIRFLYENNNILYVDEFPVM